MPASWQVKTRSLHRLGFAPAKPHPEYLPPQGEHRRAGERQRRGSRMSRLAAPSALPATAWVSACVSTFQPRDRDFELAPSVALIYFFNLIPVDLMYLFWQRATPQTPNPAKTACSVPASPRRHKQEGWDLTPGRVPRARPRAGAWVAPAPSLELPEPLGTSPPGERWLGAGSFLQPEGLVPVSYPVSQGNAEQVVLCLRPPRWARRWGVPLAQDGAQGC